MELDPEPLLGPESALSSCAVCEFEATAASKEERLHPYGSCQAGTGRHVDVTSMSPSRMEKNTYNT